MIRRPKPGEDEDDILRMQKEFLKDKTFQPAAQVVNLRRTEHQTTKRSSPTSSDTRKPSKYAQSKGLVEKRPRMARGGSVLSAVVEKNVQEEQDLPENDDIKQLEGRMDSTDLVDDKVYYPKIVSSVLGDIVEKSFDDDFSLEFKVMPSKGFPPVSKRDPNISPGSKNTHAQHIERLNKQKIHNSMDIDKPSSTRVEEISKYINVPSQSYILSGHEADDIHKENINILTKMSEQEILQEKQKLLSSLDPKIVQLMKAKRKSADLQKSIGDPPPPNVQKTDCEMSVAEPISESETRHIIENDCLWDNDVLSHPKVNQWLHFDNLEKDKLEWIKGIEDSKAKNDVPYEARFNFNGYLLPYTMEYSEQTKTLFHHGEEPHRPGYSITELIELTRSAVIQQRVMALNTIAGFLDYYMAGIYKHVIEIPLSKIFFVIRIAMDENKLILLEPAVKAMRNLLFNRIDEACLDALVGLEEGRFQPCLQNDKSEIEEMESKETELNDFHLAEIDLISAALRTDILQRLYYILDIVRPNYNCVQYALQILSRLSRNSTDTANQIVEMNHLIQTIITNFVPNASINFALNPKSVYSGKPVLAALKLLRILSLQSREIGEVLLLKYDILKPISAYISSGVDGTYGLRIQTEAFCILSNLLSFGLATENASSLCPLIITTLWKHVQGTDIFIQSSALSATHAAVVQQVINNLLNCKSLNLDSYKHHIYLLLKEGTQKWLMQTACMESYSFGHLRLLCSALDCCRTVLIKEKVTLNFLNDTLRKFLYSAGVNTITRNIIPSSNLLSGIGEGEIMNNKNLVNLGAAVVESTPKVLPVLNIVSPIPLLVSLFKLLAVIDDKEIPNLFITKIMSYLQQLTKTPLSLSNNWFTRMEVEFILSVVRLSVQCDVSESTKELIYLIANRLCYILRSDKQYELQYLFDNVIFNKQWFTAARLFNLMSLTEADSVTNLTNVGEIKQCYSEVLSLVQVESYGNVVLSKWQEPALPRDWIYLPILCLYSSSQEVNVSPTVSAHHASKVAKQQDADKEKIIRCSLEWILFNEMTFPDLISDIGVTNRFCRIMCVFLCDNSLFLDKTINILLRKCVQVLYKTCQKLDFDAQLTGLSNFQDFYTQILEQFQAVSYGDHTFVSCVLVPLAQKHNVKWRKLLWSEYAGCLRALDCPEHYLCYSLDEYYYPEETDESLLKSYRRALASNLLRPGTIVYKIAQHHVESLKKFRCVK